MDISLPNFALIWTAYPFETANVKLSPVSNSWLSTLPDPATYYPNNETVPETCIVHVVSNAHGNGFLIYVVSWAAKV